MSRIRLNSIRAAVGAIVVLSAVVAAVPGARAWAAHIRPVALVPSASLTVASRGASAQLGGGSTGSAPISAPATPTPAPAKPATPTPAPAPKPAPRPPQSPMQRQAQALLDGMIRKHPILKGMTVTIGKTSDNRQAETFYEVGQMVINPAHVAPLSRIVTHECWHEIDWRDNGRIDWGERIPPLYPRVDVTLGR